MDFIIKNVMIREGGLVDVSYEPGGMTNFGITRSVYEEYLSQKGIAYSDELVKNMSMEEAYEVYAWLYKKHSIYLIKNADVADIVFDAGVNHGFVKAVRWLQMVVGVKVDGILGAKTAEAVNRSADIITQYAVMRLKEYARLVTANPAKYGRYMYGWTVRATNFLGKRNDR